MLSQKILANHLKLRKKLLIAVVNVAELLLQMTRVETLLLCGGSFMMEALEIMQ